MLFLIFGAARAETAREAVISVARAASSEEKEEEEDISAEKEEREEREAFSAEREAATSAAREAEEEEEEAISAEREAATRDERAANARDMTERSTRQTQYTHIHTQKEKSFFFFRLSELLHHLQVAAAHKLHRQRRGRCFKRQEPRRVLQCSSTTKSKAKAHISLCLASIFQSISRSAARLSPL